jgi:hypothetical protein
MTLVAGREDVHDKIIEPVGTGRASLRKTCGSQRWLLGHHPTRCCAPEVGPIGVTQYAAAPASYLRIA